MVSQLNLGTVSSINSPFRLLLVKKGKLFSRNCGNLNMWTLLSQVCTFLICQSLPPSLLHGPLLGTLCALCEVTLNWDFNLLLANGALHDLLFCFVLGLNSASHILAKRSIQERRFLLKRIYFPRNFCVKATSCAFLVTYFLLLCYGTW